MDLREMGYFLAASQTMHFTRAAALCGVTQPTLTRGIQKLEKELGGPLFVREGGTTHLTALGRMVLPRIEDIVARSRSVRKQASLHLRLQGSDLRLGIMCSLGPSRFGPLLGRFRDAQPGIDLSLTDATPDRLAEQLLQGDLDAALMVQPEAYHERLRAEPLYAERFLVACAPGHPFAQRKAIAMRDMDGQTYLSRINCEHRDVLGSHLAAVGARLVHACRSEREDWIQCLVAAGMGVCFLPEFSAVQAGLVLRPVEDAPVARQVCLVTVSGRRWSGPLARFVEALRRTRFATPAANDQLHAPRALFR
ncbi:LysR family transcriptional regulator [Falsiroseomonas tokyonensis]|uniref:LysR family transcriptional regulator n=1 Tax=Falsiroseomonas tokyonensis TaxID=430521 RepID=A0ABV7BTR5_9PROT|nr:LysR family transcriptional regulator [Falsiroseomonas tokyonensis]MBU8538980.1 LysR family transcriptional regulator [Falsiroseomonas tokyonensis]